MKKIYNEKGEKFNPESLARVSERGLVIPRKRHGGLG